MAPSFLDFRRRSKASVRTEESVDANSSYNYSSKPTSNPSSSPKPNANPNGHGQLSSSAGTPNSSTLNLGYGSTTPPALSSPNSATNLQSIINANGHASGYVNGYVNGNANGNANGGFAMPFRPYAPPSASAPSVTSRQSVSGMSGLGSPNSTLPTSQYAPRILSISDGSWVTASLSSLCDDKC
jgi:hypothetical protein